MENYEGLNFNEESPKYVQIADYIKNLIDSKIIKDGDKLPPIRYLAKELSVNNVTIVSAYNKLKNEGYAYQKVGSGTFAKEKKLVLLLEKNILIY